MRILTEAKVDFTAVLEPHEFALYRETGGGWNYLVLAESNKGIAFVRNEILQVARERNYTWFWMLDDDITATYLVEHGRSLKTPINAVLLAAQRVFTTLGRVGQGALEYNQFAWAAKKDHAVGYCDVAVCINVMRTVGLQYRAEMELKEDRDFTLQVLSKGFLTVRASHCSFAAPKNGSNQGGLYEEYRAGKEEAASRRMAEAWPGVCTFNRKKDGRPDVKVNWRAFQAAPGKK